MTATKNAVRVTIGGEEYTVRSELPPEYTREVAAYFDAALKRVRDSLPAMEQHKIAILAGLAITDELFQARLDNMLARRDHLENFVKSLAANPKQFPDQGPRLGDISAPTLVIWGRDDRFVPMDTGLRLIAGMQDAELHVFNRCGHWAQWEHADRFNRLVLDFLLH